jgi:hypothetical protein
MRTREFGHFEQIPGALLDLLKESCYTDLNGTGSNKSLIT